MLQTSSFSFPPVRTLLESLASPSYLFFCKDCENFETSVSLLYLVEIRKINWKPIVRLHKLLCPSKRSKNGSILLSTLPSSGLCLSSYLLRGKSLDYHLVLFIQ